MSGERLEELNGDLVVHDCYRMNDEPVEMHLFWSLGVRAADFKDRVGAPVTYQGDGVYRDDLGRLYRLPHGGSTKAISVERRQVPRPKVRRGIGVRYAYCRWEKLLKAGWVPAEG